MMIISYILFYSTLTLVKSSTLMFPFFYIDGGNINSGKDKGAQEFASFAEKQKGSIITCDLN